MHSQKTFEIFPWLIFGQILWNLLSLPPQKSILDENKLFSDISLFIWAMDYIKKPTD